MKELTTSTEQSNLSEITTTVDTSIRGMYDGNPSPTSEKSNDTDVSTHSTEAIVNDLNDDAVDIDLVKEVREKDTGFDTELMGYETMDPHEKANVQYRLKEAIKDLTRGPGGGSSSDWATKSISANVKEVVARADTEAKKLFPGGEYTTHHKISRDMLAKAVNEWNKSGQSSESMRDFLKEMKTVTSAGSDKKALLNMPANLEVGPPTDRRIGDPGQGFDPNYRLDGSMTPRSEALNEADRMITQSPIDFDKLAAKLKEAHELHEERTDKVGDLTPPLTEQWKQVKNKFKRLE